MLAGVGISLLSSWDVGPALMQGDLHIVLPEWRGVSSDAIWAVYPSRDFMPSKVNVFIDYLTELYGLQPYWPKNFDIKGTLKIRPPKSQVTCCEKAAKSKEAFRPSSQKKPRGENDLTC